MNPIYPLIVVGGGPSGLFCALQAARPGCEPLVLEKNSSCGKKLLISGSGQCNITHDGDVREFISHYGDHGNFLKPALMNFRNVDLLTFLHENGIECQTEPGGKIFPACRKSTEVLSVLISECVRQKVSIRTSEPVLDISIVQGKFQVTTLKSKYYADNVVIATGGMTYPGTGSTGDGYRLAAGFGHRIVEPFPALAPVIISPFSCADLSGISIPEASISIYRAGKKVRQHKGDILFTHTGFSGPGILDSSRYMKPGDVLKISFLQGDQAALTKNLTDSLSSGGSRLVRKVLVSYPLAERVSRKIVEIAGIDPDCTISHLSRQSRQNLINTLLGCPFTVQNTGGANDAMVTGGGVCLDEIHPKTMESRLVPGLFFIGEVIDIDGDTGGYNLQAAFSMGALAAASIQKKENLSSQSSDEGLLQH